MESKSDSLIAYNVLEKKIINSGFWTLCGACEAACPVSALTRFLGKNQTIKLLQIKTDYADIMCGDVLELDAEGLKKTLREKNVTRYARMQVELVLSGYDKDV